jgi:hypothetical protein
MNDRTLATRSASLFAVGRYEALDRTINLDFAFRWYARILARLCGALLSVVMIGIGALVRRI